MQPAESQLEFQEKTWKGRQDRHHFLQELLTLRCRLFLVAKKRHSVHHGYSFHSLPFFLNLTSGGSKQYLQIFEFRAPVKSTSGNLRHPETENPECSKTRTFACKIFKESHKLVIITTIFLYLRCFRNK